MVNLYNIPFRVHNYACKHYTLVLFSLDGELGSTRPDAGESPAEMCGGAGCHRESERHCG